MIMNITQNLTKLNRKNSDKILSKSEIFLAQFFLNKFKTFKCAKKVFCTREEMRSAVIKACDRHLRKLRSELSHIFHTEYHESVKIGNKTYHHVFTIELREEYLYLLGAKAVKKSPPIPIQKLAEPSHVEMGGGGHNCPENSNNIKDIISDRESYTHSENLEKPEAKRSSEFCNKSFSNYSDPDDYSSHVNDMFFNDDKNLSKDLFKKIRDKCKRKICYNYTNMLIKKLSIKLPNTFFPSDNHFVSYMVEALDRDKNDLTKPLYVSIFFVFACLVDRKNSYIQNSNAPVVAWAPNPRAFASRSEDSNEGRANNLVQIKDLVSNILGMSPKEEKRVDNLVKGPTFYKRRERVRECLDRHFNKEHRDHIEENYDLVYDEEVLYVDPKSFEDFVVVTPFEEDLLSSLKCYLVHYCEVKLKKLQSKQEKAHFVQNKFNSLLSNDYGLSNNYLPKCKFVYSGGPTIKLVATTAFVASYMAREYLAIIQNAGHVLGLNILIVFPCLNDKEEVYLNFIHPRFKITKKVKDV